MLVFLRLLEHASLGGVRFHVAGESLRSISSNPLSSVQRFFIRTRVVLVGGRGKRRQSTSLTGCGDPVGTYVGGRVGKNYTVVGEKFGYLANNFSVTLLELVGID